MSVPPSSPIAELREPVVNGLGRCLSPRHRKQFSASTKIFNDPVHGQIALHPACVAIIDTPQFQRLRHIKQTGFTEYVYPGSSHNRYGHSLGVCYLAGKFVQELKERQPELQLSEKDVLCVSLAGLCHDLGHGPYSHTWEVFMKKICLKKNIKEKWKHENVSVNMLDWLIEENNLYPVLKQYGIGLEELDLVKDYILGAKPKDNYKAYLYQIINNDDSGLDVDKFDYFLRDCLHLGLGTSFEYERLMQYAKVFYVDGKSQICFRDKTIETVYDVFRTRSTLHRLAYQHKISIIMQQMFVDALEIADDQIIGVNGEVLHFSDWSMTAAFGDGDSLKLALEKFSMLTDDMLYVLLKFTPLSHLKKASDLIKAFDTRSCQKKGFYQHVGRKIITNHCSEEEIFQGICNFLPSAQEFMLCEKYEDDDVVKPVSSSDICVYVVRINWGKGAENPVKFVNFYTKENMYVKKCSKHLEVSIMPPQTYEELQVYVLSRRSDHFALDVIRWCYDQYWENSSANYNGHL